MNRKRNGHYGRAPPVWVKGDLCRASWKTCGRDWGQMMNVSKCLDKAISPLVKSGKYRGLLPLISYSIKVLKFRHQQAAPHSFKMGDIYVGRTLNVSRDVGSELKMANFTLVEQRRTKVKSPFWSLGTQNDEFYFGRSANDQSKIAFLAAARQVKLALVAHMRQATTEINSTLTILPPRP